MFAFCWRCIDFFAVHNIRWCVARTRRGIRPKSAWFPWVGSFCHTSTCRPHLVGVFRLVFGVFHWVGALGQGLGRRVWLTNRKIRTVGGCRPSAYSGRFYSHDAPIWSQNYPSAVKKPFWANWHNVNSRVLNYVPVSHFSSKRFKILAQPTLEVILQFGQSFFRT